MPPSFPPLSHSSCDAKIGRPAKQFFANVDRIPCEHCGIQESKIWYLLGDMPGEDEVELDGSERRWWCGGAASGGKRTCVNRARKAGAVVLDGKIASAGMDSELLRAEVSKAKRRVVDDSPSASAFKPPRKGARRLVDTEADASDEDEEEGSDLNGPTPQSLLSQSRTFSECSVGPGY